MKLQTAGERARPLKLSTADFEMTFPEPDRPLLEGPGEPVPWAQFMDEIAAQTNYRLETFGKHEVLPPPWDEPFVLD